MLLHDASATDAHKPCGVTTCRICGRGFYVYPLPQGPLQHMFCTECLTGDAPSVEPPGKRPPDGEMRHRIWSLVNKRAW